MSPVASLPLEEKAPTLHLLPGPDGRPKALEYLSASRLKCWQTCRRQFYFRYVLGIETPTAPALFLGQQVHEILRIYNWARWKGDDLAPGELEEHFDRLWNEGLNKTTVTWKKPADEANAKIQAWSLVETYVDEPPVAPEELPEGVEVRVECYLPDYDIQLVGIVDLVRPPGLIVDYKTAARAPSSAEGPQVHATQLACYALLYREATGKQESGFQLIHLIKTKQPKILVTSLGPMSAKLETQLYRIIDDYLEGIAAAAWIPSPGQHCCWCDYSRECRELWGL